MLAQVGLLFAEIARQQCEQNVKLAKQRLHEAQKSMSEQNTWIKMSDRWPEEQDLPALAGSWRHGEWIQENIVNNHPIAWDSCHTHWTSVAKPPAPQMKARTQEQKDEEFAGNFAHSNKDRCGTSNFENVKESILVGIRHERAAFQKLVDDFNAGDLKQHEFNHGVSQRCK